MLYVSILRLQTRFEAKARREPRKRSSNWGYIVYQRALFKGMRVCVCVYLAIVGKLFMHVLRDSVRM